MIYNINIMPQSDSVNNTKIYSIGSDPVRSGLIRFDLVFLLITYYVKMHLHVCGLEAQ